MARIKSK